MAKKSNNILAINPGSRYLGMAVFQGSDLIDWGIKNIRGKGLKEKIETAKRILSDLIDQYEPDAIAIKKLHSSRSSTDLDKLVVEMNKLTKTKHLKIDQYPLEAIESFFSESGKMNKIQMAELVSQKYSFLFNELEKEKANLNPYHIRMFEAVALGLVCLHDLENKH